MRGFLRCARPARGVGAVVVAGLLSGCAPAEPPVATATLGVNRVSVPLGAPLELSVRFDVAPDADALDANYRVLLHFLDPDGELLFAEDHDPPIPTSRWVPGQTVEYTRRITVPMYPYIGEALVALGLYSPESGTRVPLAGEDLGQMAYRVATIRLEPQPESSFLVYGAGWHPAEFDGDGRNDWRWTSGRAVLTVRNPRRDARLLLELEGRPDMFDEPQTVALVVGGQVLREVVLETSDAVYLEQTVPADALGGADVVELELRVDQTFNPAARGGAPEDTRELGVRVFYAYFEPV